MSEGKHSQRVNSCHWQTSQKCSFYISANIRAIAVRCCTFKIVKSKWITVRWRRDVWKHLVLSAVRETNEVPCGNKHLLPVLKVATTQRLSNPVTVWRRWITWTTFTARGFVLSYYMLGRLIIQILNLHPSLSGGSSELRQNLWGSLHSLQRREDPSHQTLAGLTVAW